jgi:hypothetical protein
MPKRRKGQGIDFVIGGYRKVVNDKASTVAQRLKALDRLAVIDGILEIKLVEPNDQTRQPEPDPAIDDQKASRAVEQALANARKMVEDQDEIPRSEP